MKNSTLKKIAALVLVFCLQLAFFVPAATVPAKAEQEHTIVIASSDFQADSDALSASQLAEILAAVKKDYPQADGYLHCGDYTVILKYLAWQSESGMAALLKTIDDADLGIPDYEIILGQGNHDPNNTSGLASFGNNDHDEKKYGVFNIREDGYMWMAGTQSNNGSENIALHESTVKDTAERLRRYLHAKAEQGFSAPIFVISHLPLHFCMRTVVYGDSRYAHYLTDVLNEGAELGLNIIFLFGHNHSQGWDNYLGASCVYLPKGSTMKIASKGTNMSCEDVKIGFTYMNAGYTGYYHTDFGEDIDDTLTVSVFDITEDSVEIRRYSKDGMYNLKSKGVQNLKVFGGRSEANMDLYKPNTAVISSPQILPLVTEAKTARATCTEDGVTSPWYYFDYEGEYYSDIFRTRIADPEKLAEKATGHSFRDGKCTRCGYELERIDGNPASCVEEGRIPCFHDKQSGVYYADANGAAVLAESDLIIPLIDHSPDENGKCSVCGKQVFDPPAPSTAPPTTAPQSTAPQTTAPRSTAPQTTAPRSTAPQSTAPQSTAPKTTAPQSTAPQSTAPQTTAPQTTEPLSAAPASTEPVSTAPESTETSSSAPASSEPLGTEPVSTLPATGTAAPSSVSPGPEGLGTPAIIAICAGAALLIAGAAVLFIKRKK
ncbi:MAG: hypothetical protein IJV00_03135 [Clostridia bacterium]|nr:hypothetical protein [Clostridia bacterium]